MKLFLPSLRLAVITLLVTVAAAADSTEKVVTPKSTISLFNGKDLSQFYTWLRGHKYNDPDRVFTIVNNLDGGPAIRASGQHYGGFVTKERYANYRLTLEFRWGSMTWEPRKDKARDAGILLHCQRPDGSAAADFGGPWMRSVEFQIIEGGTGDMLLVGGFDKAGGERILTKMTAPVRSVPTPGGKAGSVTYFWDPKGVPTLVAGGRVNWYGRDPNWTGALGYRGPQDVEKPLGEWNRLEAICDGDSVVYLVNGVTVNSGTGSSLGEGRILFQSEGAEVFYRKIELHPLRK
ncbi:MAG: hypothetical protein RIQ93_141 [Verrucomicrobiota bacterium]|jgi:hypothetical protein